MAFGLIMLALTCVGAYIYFYHMKPASDVAIESSGSAALAAKAQELKALIPQAEQNELHNCPIGTLVQIKDVGLELIQVDGIVNARHLMSGGPVRWSITTVDQGNRLYKVHQNHTDQQNYFLESGTETLNSLGLDPEHFIDIHRHSMSQFNGLGQNWTLNGKISARYHDSSNHLEQIPCLIWFYDEPAGLQRIQITRFPDQIVSVQVLEKFERGQINIVTSLS